MNRIPQSDSWPRIILHADMDAFFAAVEQRDDPSLRGKPLAVGGSLKRGVVSTASYEARKFGIKSAMPMVEALRRCPDIIVRPPDMPRYKAVSDIIHDVFHRYSPLVEPLSLDEAFIDMSGAEKLFGPPEEMARLIKRDVLDATEGLTISVGASVTKYVAKVASDFQKPDGLTIVPPEAVTAFLHPLSVDRLWGVGKKTKAKLLNMGLTTIRAVAACDEGTLKRAFGIQGEHLFRLANGIDPREVVPERDPKSVGKELTFEEDISGRENVWRHMRRLADQVARRLRTKRLTAAGVRIKLKTADFKLITRQETLPSPTDSGPELLRAADLLLDKIDLNRPFRLVGIAGFNLTDDRKPLQTNLFPDPVNTKNRKLDRAIDAVLEKFGDEAMKRGSDCEETSPSPTRNRE